MEATANNPEEQKPRQAAQIQNKTNIHLQFENITYTIKSISWNNFRFEKKEVLKGVSGSLKPGELTGILGASGSGKTTLLNILAGYTTKGANGEIRINGKNISASQPGGRGGARYIQQENHLRPKLTVYESMYFAAALKLIDLNYETRDEKIVAVLNNLNLYKSRRTQCLKLSGGEKRRLVVAMELLTDPSLLFLDEPLTGLDASSSMSLVVLLSTLAKSGRTIVMTIHQPSALMLQSLDTIYCLANGKTLYNGPREHVIPALEHVGLCCPPYHNPVDFLLEVASAQCQASVEKVATDLLEYTRGITSGQKEYKNISIRTPPTYENECETFKWRNIQHSLKETQILISRAYVIASKSTSIFLFRVLVYLILAFLVSGVYRMAGADASTLIGNISSIYSCTMIALYGALMYITLLLLMEIEILQVEYFNRWFSLGPYMISTISVELPFQIMITFVFSWFCYWLTGNPLESKRVLLYIGTMILVALSAQAWGFFLAATTSIKAAVLLGPLISCVYSMYSFSITLRNTPYALRWLYHISYVRAACHVATHAIYGLNRTKLPCTKEYCYYTDANTFLKDFELVPFSVAANIAVVVATGTVMYILTYGALYVRLNKR